MLELERDRDRNRQPVSVCVFPDIVFLFPLLIFLHQFIPLGSLLEALDDERFSYGPGPWQVKLAIAEPTPRKPWQCYLLNLWMRRGFLGARPNRASAANRNQAAQRIQALIRGCASWRRDIYQNLPVEVKPGHRFVKSTLNLLNYQEWLNTEFRAEPDHVTKRCDRRDRARAVHLSLLHHLSRPRTRDSGT